MSVAWDPLTSPAAVMPGRHGVWTTCDRCGRDNWCVGDPWGYVDDISGELEDYVCWDFCAAVEDEWDDEVEDEQGYDEQGYDDAADGAADGRQ